MDEAAATYKKFPPLQAPATYNLEQVMEQVKKHENPSGLAADTNDSGRPTGRPPADDKSRSENPRIGQDRS